MTIYYTDSNASDDTGDGSIGDPWKYIQTHVDELSAGDVMYLRGNASRGSAQVYAEDVRIGPTWGCANGSSGSPITIAAYPGEYVIIRSSSSGVEIIRFLNVSYWTIEGLDSDLHIDFDKQSQSDMVINCDNADNMEFYYCELRDGDYYGIEFDDQSDNCWVEGCLIHDFDGGQGNDVHGIYVKGGDNVTVSNCEIYNCHGDCIQVESDGADTDNLTVSNCTLYVEVAHQACVENAIDLKDGAGHYVYGNVIHGFGLWDDTCGGTGAGYSAPAIQIHGGTGTFEDNLIYDCVTAFTHTYSGAGTIIIQNNIIRDNVANPGAGPSAALYKSGSQATYFYNNTVHSMDDYTVYLADGSSSTTIKNNIFSDSGDVNTGTATYTCDHNCWYDVTDSISGSGDVTSEPSFRDEADDDFRLMGNSPCISAATDVGLDYYGAGPDIGAYEFEIIKERRRMGGY